MNLKVDESVIHEELNLAWAGETDTLASASVHAQASTNMLLRKSAVARSPEQCGVSRSIVKATAFCSITVAQSVHAACDRSQKKHSTETYTTSFSAALLVAWRPLLQRAAAVAVLAAVTDSLVSAGPLQHAS